MQIIQLTLDRFDRWRTEMEALLKETVIHNFFEYLPPQEYYKNTIENLYQYLAEEKAIVFLAIINEELSGWIWCHEIYRFEKRRLHIASFAVKENSRNNGIGENLFSTVEKYAKEHEIKGIDLMVTKSNKQAVRFYNKHGFETERFLMKKGI